MHSFAVAKKKPSFCMHRRSIFIPFYQCHNTRSIIMLSGTLGNSAKSTDIVDIRVWHLLLYVAGKYKLVHAAGG